MLCAEADSNDLTHHYSLITIHLFWDLEQRMAVEIARSDAPVRVSSLPKRRKQVRPIVLWLVPIVGLLLFFAVVPIFASFYLSFFDYEILQRLQFVGVNNYLYAFTTDPAFFKTLVNTFYFSLVSVPLGMALALLLAQLIHTRSHFKSFFRTAFFMSYIMPAAAIALVWSFIFQAS